MKNLKTMLLLLALILPALSHAQEKLYVSKLLSIPDEAGVRDAIRDECNLTNTVGAAVYAALAKAIPEVVPLAENDKPSDGATLTFTMLSASGVGGGGWSGSKTMTVRADYKVGGKFIDSKVVNSRTMGGLWGTFKGICTTLERAIPDISKEIVAWAKATRNSPSAYVGSPPAKANAEKSPAFALISPIEFEDKTIIRREILDECAIPTVVEGYLLEKANALRQPVRPVAQYDGKGSAIRVMLLNAQGDHSEEKLLLARAEFLHDGKSIASKEFTRTKSAFTSFNRSNCLVFEGMTRSVAVLVMEWSISQRKALLEAANTPPVPPSSAGEQAALSQ